jgi:microcystin-dependent protein
MACSNCFNGCTEIISDQCVKYTGNTIEALDIQNGDTLSEVNLKITNFILSLSTGEGIIPVINSEDLCALVEGFLPESGDITLNQVISALIQSICSLKTSVTNIESTLTILNADYTLPAGCLTGVTASSDTHAILQAAITKLCATDDSLTSLLTNLPLNYVQLNNLNQLIQDYIDSPSYTPPPATFQRDKMVPYVVYEYYGPITDFDITGKGITGTQWEDVYLCNGSNGTPDKRGRVAVGVTDGTMGGGAMNSAVLPGGGNPNYTLEGTAGANTVTLTLGQIPSHTHTATAVSTSTPHSHFIARGGNGQSDLTAGGTIATETSIGLAKEYRLKQISGVPILGTTSSSSVTVNTSVTVDPVGGSSPAHPNVQPGIGAYFIQYRP